MFKLRIHVSTCSWRWTFQLVKVLSRTMLGSFVPSQFGRSAQTLRHNSSKSLPNVSSKKGATIAMSVTSVLDDRDASVGLNEKQLRSTSRFTCWIPMSFFMTFERFDLVARSTGVVARTTSLFSFSNRLVPGGVATHAPTESERARLIPCLEHLRLHAVAQARVDGGHFLIKLLST